MRLLSEEYEMSVLIPVLVAMAQQTTKVSTDQDYKETLAMLGVTSLRPGADGFRDNLPNSQNKDETKAELYKNYPELLKFEGGRPVKTKSDWERRRRELFALFDQEIYGKVPAKTPRVTWEVTKSEVADEAGMKVLRKTLVGHVDNSSYKAVKVDIPLVLVVPATEKKVKVPVILEFGFGFGRPPARPGQAPVASWTDMVLKKGWGYAVLTPTGVQADNGGGLREGIIGLVNKGQLRKRDDWGALRAWAWGASRVLDYFESDSNVDAKRVAIEGISRYGKAALVTMAYEPRFFAGFVGSSGSGGAKLWRRDFGEREGNIASSGEYHWMAPEFINYAGPKTPGDMPVDQHQLIALCAPRAVFVGCGSPKVEGTWVDDTGMFRATVMASPAWELLGAKGLAATTMPDEDHGLTDGVLAWRQHSGGHTNVPNFPAFLEWFGQRLGPK